MGNQTLKNKIKDWIAYIAWKIFLWAIDMTDQEYWEEIYNREAKRKRFEATPEVKKREKIST